MTRILFIISILIGIASCNTATKLPAEMDTYELSQELLKTPKNANLYFLRAKQFYDRKSIDSAFVDAQLAVNIDTTNKEYNRLLANIAFNNNKTSITKKSFERVLQADSTDTEALVKLAELHLYVQMYQPAINYCNRLLRRNKNYPKGYFIKGMIYKELKDTATAISSFQTTIEQDNKYVDAFEQLGNIYLARLDKKAIYYYDAALAIQPALPGVLYNKAFYYQQLDSTNKAIVLYENFISAYPTAKQGYHNLGYMYLYDKQNYPTALSYFDKAIALDTNYLGALENKQITLQKMRKSAEANALNLLIQQKSK